jgi:outer membrane receptor protein involved in Fe transport
MAADVMFNFPIGDSTAVRFNYSRIDNDGMIDYVNAYELNSFGEPMIAAGGNCVDPRSATDAQVLNNLACFRHVEDADTVEIDYARIALRSEVTDNFSFQLAYQTQEDDIGGRRSTTLGNNNQPAGSDLFFTYGDDDSGQVLLEPSERDADMVSLDLEFDFGFATFTSTSSSYDHEGMGDSDNGGLWASGGEVDGTSRDWNFNFYGGGWPRPAQRAARGYDDSAFIQEFRLVSNERKGNIDWLVGAFYMDQDTDVWQLSYNPGMNLFLNTGGPACDGFWPKYYNAELTEIDFEYVRSTSYEEKAIYGELTWHFSDTARVTGGIRWFDNDTVNDTKLGFPLVVGWTSPNAPQSKASDDDILFKLNASWDLANDKMLYATYSEGYRHGGAQAVPSLANGDPFGEPNAEAIRTFESDSVNNYEIGLKGTRGNMSYTVSAFHVDWDDPQLNYTSAWYGFYLAGNGDAASTQGIELEVEGYFDESLHYRVGYTYVDAELDKDFLSPQTGSLSGPSGATLPGAPSSTLSLNLDKSWQLNGDMDLIVGLNSYYQSDSENYISTTSQFSEEWGSFWLTSLSATLAADSWSATLYVKNAGNEEGVTGGFPVSYWSYDTGVFENWYGNGARQFIVQPRTIGLKLGYRF